MTANRIFRPALVGPYSSTGELKGAEDDYASLSAKAATQGMSRHQRSRDLNCQRDIAVMAYYLAAQRGFAPGHELDDWLAAEARVLAEVDEPKDRSATHLDPAAHGPAEKHRMV